MGTKKRFNYLVQLPIFSSASFIRVSGNCLADKLDNLVAEGSVRPYPLILHRLHWHIRSNSNAKITKG